MSRWLLFFAVLLAAVVVGVTVAVVARDGGNNPGRDAPTNEARERRAEPAPTSGKVVRLEGDGFRCPETPLKLSLLKVYDPPSDRAVYGPCTGYIGRIEIDTWYGDGIRWGSQAHDLVIAGGYIRCHDIEGEPATHQDGIHDMGSSNVTIRNVEVSCWSSNHSALYLNQGLKSPKPVTNFIFENGILRTDPKQAQNNDNAVHIAGAENSGVRNSHIYDDAIRGDSPTLVNENNVFHPAPGPTWKPPCTDGCPALTDRR
jgi:hypothetical protein